MKPLAPGPHPGPGHMCGCEQSDSPPAAGEGLPVSAWDDHRVITAIAVPVLGVGHPERAQGVCKPSWRGGGAGIQPHLQTPPAGGSREGVGCCGGPEGCTVRAAEGLPAFSVPVPVGGDSTFGEEPPALNGLHACPVLGAPGF